MAGAPRYIPYLFDSRTAWERTVADPRCTYDLRFEDFMKLYTSYRQGGAMSSAPAMARSSPRPAAVSMASAATPPPRKATAEDKGQILDQSEIDALISQMTGG
jgi:hypothetical protein